MHDVAYATGALRGLSLQYNAMQDRSVHGPRMMVKQPILLRHLMSGRDCRPAQHSSFWYGFAAQAWHACRLVSVQLQLQLVVQAKAVSKPAVIGCKTHVLKAAWQASCSSALMVPWCTRVIAVVLMNWASPLATLRAACSLPCSAHHRLIRSDHMLGCMVGGPCTKARQARQSMIELDLMRN